MTWLDCYKPNGWKGLIADAAFAHPAKFSRHLIARIYDELALPPGAYVLDPFGGIALGAFEAIQRGFHWRGCELEEKFHRWGRENLIAWSRRLDAVGTGYLARGDSRHLREVMRGEGAFAAVLSLPPYADSVKGEHGEVETAEHSRDVRHTLGGAMGRSLRHGGYGGRENLGNLLPGDFDAVLSSPPYGSRTVHDGNAIDASLIRGAKPGKHSQMHGSGYGDTPGQVGRLPDDGFDAVVSSPPFSEGTQNQPPVNRRAGAPVRSHREAQGLAEGCGRSVGNLAAAPRETFWQAAKQIVAECRELLKSNGVAAWVTKDYVKKGRRVPFSDQWRRLCESLGFETTQHVKASFIESDGTQRKSFFRHMQETKARAKNYWATLPDEVRINVTPKQAWEAYLAAGGDPRSYGDETIIDHEDVFFMRKVAR